MPYISIKPIRCKEHVKRCWDWIMDPAAGLAVLLLWAAGVWWLFL